MKLQAKDLAKDLFRRIRAKIKRDFHITNAQLRTLFRVYPAPSLLTKFLLYLLALLLTPITLAGALIGFAKSYNKFFLPQHKGPELHPLAPVSRAAMAIWAGLLWAVLIVFALLLFFILRLLVPLAWGNHNFLLSYLIACTVATIIIFGIFKQWQYGVRHYLQEKRKFGSARIADVDELQDYTGIDGLYVGSAFTFRDKGHLLSCAGTRSGKFTNIIAPNLLGARVFENSWVIIDPKGEICAVTARFQREQGKRVVILNPWGILQEEIMRPAPHIKLKNGTYNPLDILNDTNNAHLVDDIQVIAEMIVPTEASAKNDSFFTDNARALIAGLLLHMATYPDVEECTLKTLWQWVRLRKEEFEKLIENMHCNDHPMFGEVVKQAANEIEKLMFAGDRTFGSIIATALQCTDFIKSPSLQKSMESGYDPKELSDGNTVLYVIIPADKLKSHSRWLRLVVTTTMRAVVRKPNKRVCFLLDEFASLGYLPEVSEIALATYAGFNITVWPIIQSLIQLKSLYGDGWENFIGNTAVRHYFGVNDNFTAKYVSAAIGDTSEVQYEKNWLGIYRKVRSNARPLITSDEVRRGSGDNIFTFFGSKPVIYFPKVPYYTMPYLIDNGKPRYDDNPYYKG